MLRDTTMFDHILVCCDDSEPSLAAAQIAAAVGRGIASQTTQLTVLDPQSVILPVQRGGGPGASDAETGACGPRSARRTRMHSSGSVGGPQMPVPVRRMAPNPRRLTVRSPPMLNVPDA